MKTLLSYSPSRIATLVKVYNGVATTMLVVLIILCFLADTDLMSTGSAEYRQLIVARLFVHVCFSSQSMPVHACFSSRSKPTHQNQSHCFVWAGIRSIVDHATPRQHKNLCS
jgi:hypothetical protein